MEFIQNLFRSFNLEHKLCAKYHNPSLRGSPDILFTMSLMAKMPMSEKGHNSVKYSQNFTKNQVICIMCPNSMPDIMILAPAVLQLFY